MKVRIGSLAAPVAFLGVLLLGGHAEGIPVDAHRSNAPKRQVAPTGGDDNDRATVDTLPVGTRRDVLGSGLTDNKEQSTGDESRAGDAPAAVGACCNTVSRICVDNIAEETCNGADEQWNSGRCCNVECRDPNGPEYDSLNVNLLSRVPISAFFNNSFAANDVWGYTSPRGFKYAILGLGRGTGFVDVTDPRNPVVIADIPDAGSTWSDMASFGHYVYNVNEASGGIQIIDVIDIDNGNVILLGSAVGGMSTAHNIYVNPDSGRAYPCGTNLFRGFMIFDLSDPSNPIPIGVWEERYVHDLQVVSYGACPTDAGHIRSGQPCEIAFLFTGDSGVWIVDVTDASDILTLSTLTYPTVEYCHQGWLSEDRRYLFFNDELDELYSSMVSNVRTYVADVQNLSSPTLAHTFDGPSCNIDHNMMVRGDRLYEAHYAAGLRVVDASDPLNLSEIGYFDTHPQNNITNFVGDWGVYTGFPTRLIAVSDMERGLFILCDEPDKPIPSFTLSRHPMPVGSPILFDGTSSTHCDPSLSIASYEWDFDYDGVTFDVDAVGPIPSHTFAVDGTYTVALRVTGSAPSPPLAGSEANTASSQVITALTVETGASCVRAGPPEVMTFDVLTGTDAGTYDAQNVRYLSFRAGEPGRLQAIRVTFTELPPAFSYANGRSYFVGPPVQVTENAGKRDPADAPGFPTFLAAPLQCEPFYMDWHGSCPPSLNCVGGLKPGAPCSTDEDCREDLHVYGEGIVSSHWDIPSNSLRPAMYRVQAIDQDCLDLSNDSSYSVPLTLIQSRWGDLVGNCGGDVCTPPDDVVGMTTDVTATLNKFKNLAGAPNKSRSDVEPSLLDQMINISDVTKVLDGFRGLAYSLAGPPAVDPCP